MDEKLVGAVSIPGPPCWKVYVDGTTNQRGTKVGLVLEFPEKTIIEKSLRLGFSATNNEAEYEALLQGMAMVRKMGGKAIEMFPDSRLVMGQVKGELEARDTRMQEYLSQVKCLQSDFDLFSLSHVSRSGNTHVDSLATLATSSVGSLPQVILVEHLDRASEVAKGIVRIHEVRVGPSWMDPIVKFLKDDILPEEKSKVEKYEETLHGFGCPRITNCTSAPILGHIYYVFTLRHWSYCLKSYTRVFVGVTQEENLCRTELLPRDIGCQECKRKPWNTLRNMASAKGLPRISISQEEFSTFCPTYGRLPSRAWKL